MHVTLVRPPLLFSRARPSNTVKVAPPLGMAYVAGSLRAEGHQVTCIDALGEALSQFRDSSFDPKLAEQGLSFTEILERIPSSSQVIGITSMFSFEWMYLIELIRAIRSRFPQQFIVLGGEHAT